MKAHPLADLVKEVKVDNIVFRADLYPRLKTSAETVQKYAEDLDVLPAIEINQKNELIDGWHRWTAHKKKGADKIRSFVTETASDAEVLELAIERNAKFGLQLSQNDKRDMAVQIYKATPLPQQGAKKKRLAAILSVSEETIRIWLARTDKDNKEKRDVAIFELWLACYTQDEIAERVGMTHQGVAKVLQQIQTFGFVAKVGDLEEIEDDEQRTAALAERNRALAEHTAEFEPPLYNVWKQREKTAAIEHFGNSEVRWVDNLLYLFTKPFDIVVDPFAGGGSTIELCKKRLRRYWVSDRKPIVERAHEIRQHDLTTGIPALPRWQDVKLVYLDPPYWKQAEGKYSKDKTDLANMELDEFHDKLYAVINGFAKKLPAGAVIALILQPTQWKAPERQYTDHVAEMIRRVKLPIALRIQAPYESEQYTAQMVEWAKKNRTVLVLSREIVVWRV